MDEVHSFFERYIKIIARQNSLDYDAMSIMICSYLGFFSAKTVEEHLSRIAMPEVIFVTGGARSGKSTYALDLAGTYVNRVFLATAEAFDEEMRDRIDRHREERKNDYLTVEEPVFLDQVLQQLPEETGVVLVDCLTVWLGNLMHRFGEGEKITERIDALLGVLKRPPCDIILVSNEVGMGIVPDNALSRSFRDHAGTLNRKVAEIADRAYLICSGLPLVLKSRG
jgi:adenosylcobinamide kinase/adenosylcobinamide-phosphate guanylyltransferase